MTSGFQNLSTEDNDRRDTCKATSLTEMSGNGCRLQPTDRTTVHVESVGLGALLTLLNSRRLQLPQPQLIPEPAVTGAHGPSLQ